MVSVTIEHLSKRFAPVVALDDVSLQIAPGELFFLLGPSGSGKTTLLRTVAGFCRPDHGRILCDGEEITGLPPHRRGMGMMFQSYALWPHMSVAENVAFGLEEQRVARAEIIRRVEAALVMVQMSGHGDRRVPQLSGGQQQRVALARALVTRPRCLLLDEPLSSLDTQLRLEMRREIRRLCREAKLTAIYVTHDQQEALGMADRIGILQGGRLLQVGTPEEIYRRPRSRFVGEFMGEADCVRGRIAERRGERVVLESELGALEASTPAGEWSVGQAVDVLVRPEAWEMQEAGAPQAAGEGLTITGEIEQCIPRWDGCECWVRCGPGAVRIKVRARYRGVASAAGSVSLRAAAEDIMIVPEGCPE